MGSFCGSLFYHDEGHTLAGPPSTASGRNAETPAGQSDARSAAAAAAEERLRSEQTRGVSKANPNPGRLAAKLQASKSGTSTETEQPERIVWD